MSGAFTVLDVQAGRIEVSGYTAGTSGFVILGDDRGTHTLDLVAARRLAVVVLLAISDAEPVVDDD